MEPHICQRRADDGAPGVSGWRLAPLLGDIACERCDDEAEASWRTLNRDGRGWRALGGAHPNSSCIGFARAWLAEGMALRARYAALLR